MGIIFDIQTYAVYDGPGIRSCVFFKGCPLRCAWCHNPESQRPRPETSSMTDRCTGCGTCVEACPNGALALSGGRVKRDARRCTACGACVRACPNGVHETIGYETDARTLVDRVIVDKPFFVESSGGVTLTGGEPTMQEGFLLETAARFREAGVHTALETCGHFRDGLVPGLIDAIDLFLFDIKHADAPIHKRLTGVDNAAILRNFSAVLKKAGSARIVPRVPLIPGFNADRASLATICRFLTAIHYHGPVHLMPYNPMARSKYGKLGRLDDYRDMGRLSEEGVDELAAVPGDFGFEVVINH
jgi:pyruvate formate lyase activating enzyme